MTTTAAPRHEKTTETTSYKILSVKNTNGDSVWMLLSIIRRLWQCDDIGGGKPAVTDVVNMKLQVLGAATGGYKTGDTVMEMRGEADFVGELVRFSNGYIVVENPWRGLRIGTYMMNILVTWATENYPSYNAFGIKLMNTDATEDNKERRNRFYDQFGFKFKWSTADFSEGDLEEIMPIIKLAPVPAEKWTKTITEHELVPGIEKLFCEVQTLLLERATLKYRNRCLEEDCKYLREELGRRDKSQRKGSLLKLGLGLLAGAATAFYWMAHA